MVAVVQGENWQQKTLPKHLRWAEECEEEITEWLRELYRNWDNGAVTLAVAFNETAKTSDRVGEQFTASWSEIKEAYRVRLMTTGRKILLKTWQSNYEVYIDEAIEVLKAHRPAAAPAPTCRPLACRRPGPGPCYSAPTSRPSVWRRSSGAAPTAPSRLGPDGAFHPNRHPKIFSQTQPCSQGFAQTHHQN